MPVKLSDVARARDGIYHLTTAPEDAGTDLADDGGYLGVFRHLPGGCKQKECQA